MAWTKPEPLLPEVEFKDFVEGRILNIEDAARDIRVNQMYIRGELSELKIRLVRIEDLLRKKRKT